MRKVLAVMFLLSFLMLSAFLPNVFAVEPELRAVYSANVPTINGQLNSSEWSDAVGYKFNLSTVPAGANVSTWLYLKHNGTYMFMGLVVWRIGTSIYDEFIINLDEGNDGGYGSGTRDYNLTSYQEDRKVCVSNNTLRDGSYKNGSFYTYTVEIDFDAKCNYETDHSTAAWEIEYWEGLGWVDDHWECEFAIPFVGNDGGTQDVSDLVATMADTIGIKIQYFINGVGSYYYPAGTLYQIDTYANLRFPAPTIESSNATGTKKDTFNLYETVYVNGSGYLPSTTYDLYIVNDVENWTDGMSIPTRVSDTATNVTSDSSGDVLPTAVWSDPATVGKYDIVVDVNGNGLYDAEIDALDDNDTEVTAGFIIPEFTSLILLSLFMVATLLAATVYRRKHSV